MSVVKQIREPRADYLALEEPALLRGFELLATAEGGVAKLRELVLSLAVQGKLVTRDISNETAGALLLRLWKHHPEPPARRALSHDARTAPYQLPNTWAWAALGDLVESMGSGWSPACDEGKRIDGHRWAVLRTTAVQVMEYRPDEHKALPLKLTPRPDIEVKRGDILITRAGPMNRVGISCAVNETPPRLMLSDKIVRFHPTSDELLPAFVVLALNAGWSREQLEQAKTGMAASQVNISQAQIKKVLVPICGTAEQGRIVARVEELMTLCDELEARGRLADEQHARLTTTLFDALTASDCAQTLADNWQRIATHFDLLLDRPQAVDALEQTILQLAVRGLLVPQDASDEPASNLLFRIHVEKDRVTTKHQTKHPKAASSISEDDQPFCLPPGWAWARFTELGEFGRGKSKHRPRNDSRLFNPGIYPLIQTGEVSRSEQFIEKVHSRYSEEGLAQSKLWPKGTMCITIAANIADSAILTFDACFPDSVVGFVPAQVLGDARYFLTFMKTARQRLIDFAPATAQKNINLEVLSNVLIPLPPLAEMHRIIARVEKLRHLCADLRKCMNQYRDAQSHLADALAADVIHP